MYLMTDEQENLSSSLLVVLLLSHLLGFANTLLYRGQFLLTKVFFFLLARNLTRFCIRRNIQSGGEHHDQPWKICVIGLNWTFSFTLTTATTIQANTVIKWHKLVSYFSQFWFWDHNIQLSNSWIKAAEGSLITFAESVLQRWQQLDS